MPLNVCPTCGESYYTASADVQLTERQHRICKAVGAVGRNNGDATTQAVAVAVGWSVSTVWRELIYLEQLGEVTRPSPRGGWRRVVRHGIKLEKVSGY